MKPTKRYIENLRWTKEVAERDLFVAWTNLQYAHEASMRAPTEYVDDMRKAVGTFLKAADELTAAETDTHH